MRSNVEKLAQSLQPWYNRNAGASPQSFRRDKGVIHLKRTLIYDNPLNDLAWVKDFILEGSAALSFPQGRLRLENRLDPSLQQKANYVFWCPEDFPSDIAITWDFWPVREPGPMAETVKICLTPL